MQKHRKYEMLNYQNMQPAAKISIIALAYLQPWINAITEFEEIIVVMLANVRLQIWRSLQRRNSL